MEGSSMSAETFKNIFIHGLADGLNEADMAYWRSRFDSVARKYLNENKLDISSIIITTEESFSANTSRDTKRETPIRKPSEDLTVEERAKQYSPRKSLFEFEFLILPKLVKEEILSAVNLMLLEKKIFDEWNLRKIEPFPRMALNFHGEPGTGKTLAAHAIANKLDRAILVASYAQIESKFHGDGPKNVEAIFFAAERDNAVLFIDEADSLLSKRLTNVTQGSEQAINSMRSQLLICLEQFRGIVIFATNLVSNYDKAFETRVRNIHFPLPDRNGREEIWRQHLLFEGGPPLAGNISFNDLAEIEDVCGRDIKNAVMEAALQSAQSGDLELSMVNLSNAIHKIKSARIKNTLSDAEIIDVLKKS